MPCLRLQCNKYIDWMKENEVHLPQHMYEQACKVWHGTDMLEEMKHKMDIKPTLFEVYKVTKSLLDRAAHNYLTLL